MCRECGTEFETMMCFKDCKWWNGPWGVYYNSFVFPSFSSQTQSACADFQKYANVFVGLRSKQIMFPVTHPLVFPSLQPTDQPILQLPSQIFAKPLICFSTNGETTNMLSNSNASELECKMWWLICHSVTTVTPGFDTYHGSARLALVRQTLLPQIMRSRHTGENHVAHQVLPGSVRGPLQEDIVQEIVQACGK